MKNKEIADALLQCDLSNVSIGDKAIIAAAVEALTRPVIFNRGTLKADGQFWMPTPRIAEMLKEQGLEVVE